MQSEAELMAQARALETELQAQARDLEAAIAKFGGRFRRSAQTVDTPEGPAPEYFWLGLPDDAHVAAIERLLDQVDSECLLYVPVLKKGDVLREPDNVDSMSMLA